MGIGDLSREQELEYDRSCRMNPGINIDFKIKYIEAQEKILKLEDIISNQTQYIKDLHDWKSVLIDKLNQLKNEISNTIV